MGKFYTIEELNENARLSNQYALEAQLIRDTMNKKAKPAEKPKTFISFSKELQGKAGAQAYRMSGRLYSRKDRKV